MRTKAQAMTIKGISIRAVFVAIAFSSFLVASLKSKAQTQPPRSNFREMLSYVTDVKSQKGRNMCTVFALTAVIESLYMRTHDPKGADFSEEWVQYLAAGSRRNASGGAKGSTVLTNLIEVKTHGITSEKLMPFDGGKWSASSPETKKYCGHLSGLEFTRCQYGKRSPRFIRMSDNQLRGLPGGEAFAKGRSGVDQFRSFTNSLKLSSLANRSGGNRRAIENIKAHINAGYTMALELNVHYGSWNHAGGKAYGIDVSDKLFAQGVITYPERGSIDRTISDQHPARHAVQILGYDDDIEITYQKKMNDGSTKTFSRKGVYYIKNSWGKNFGSNFKFERSRIRGLGMITQDYAHDLGKISVVTVQ